MWRHMAQINQRKKPPLQSCVISTPQRATTTLEGLIETEPGYTDAYDCLAVVAAIEFTLKKLGYQVQMGAGVAAAQKVLAQLF